ncbi:hypothetical protein [Streptomyces sp. NPDC002537]
MSDAPGDTLRAAAEKLRALATAAASADDGAPTAHWRYEPQCHDSGKRWGTGHLYAIDTAEQIPTGLGRGRIRLLHGGGHGTRSRAPFLTDGVGEYIAAMGPATGLALAELLAAEADVADDFRRQCPALTDGELAAWVHGPLTIALHLLGEDTDQ